MPCDWLLPGEGTEQSYASNARIIMVANFYWQTTDGEPNAHPANQIVPAPVLLNGVPKSGPLVSPVLHGSEALVLRPVPGRNVINNGPCTWTVTVGDAPDNAAPEWVSPPTASAVGPAGVSGEGGRSALGYVPTSRSLGFTSWAADLSEPAILVVWKLGSAYPRWIIPAPGAGLHLLFGLHTGDPSDLVMIPQVAWPQGGARVVRPMDSAGNFGDAWSIDPATGVVAHIEDASNYRWDELAAVLTRPP